MQSMYINSNTYDFYFHVLEENKPNRLNQVYLLLFILYRIQLAQLRVFINIHTVFSYP